VSLRPFSLHISTCLLALALLAAVPIALYAMLVVNRLADEKNEALLANLRARSVAVSNAIDGRIDAASAALEVLAQDLSLQQDDLRGFHEHARKALRLGSPPFGENIALIDRDGRHVVNTRLPVNGDLYHTRTLEVVQRLFATGQRQVTGLFTGMSGQLRVAIDVPVRQGGEVVYDLRMTIALTALNNALKEELPPGWLASVIDSEGMIIARSRSPETFIGQPATPDYLEAIQGRDQGFTVSHNKEGIRVRSAFLRLPSSGWVVAVAVPLDLIDAPRHASMIQVVAAGIALVALAALGAFLFARWLSRHVARTADAATVLGSGSEPRPPATPIAEIRRLGEALRGAYRLLSAREESMRRATALAEQACIEAERANHSKSRFLAAASHDLRQPLQSLLLYTELLGSHVHDDKGHRILGTVEQSLASLKLLLDSLLDVSRLDAGTITPEIREFPLDEVLDHIIASYAPIAAKKGLAFEGCRESCLTVRSDPTLLSRMLRNLVENAVRYTEKGRVWLECHRTDRTLRIEVHDTGIGIPPKHLERIFEEFHQVSSTGRDRSQGLGLGLAIVQRLSHLLDHPIEVRSAQGAGSTFSVEIPLGASGRVPSAPEPTADPTPAREQGMGKLALVVDDEAAVLMGLQEMLENWGYEVIAAESAEQAIERLLAIGRRPDVIVSDYRLREGRTGTEVIVQVRDLFAESVPAIVLTGEAGPECLQDAEVHGFGVTQKPALPHQLSLALERELRTA